MHVVEVPIPYGHLVASGQKTIILSRFPFDVQAHVVIRNTHTRLNGDRETLLEQHGASLGPPDAWGANYPGAAVALAVVGRAAPFIVTAEDVVRAMSLQIIETQDKVLALFGQDLPQYGLWLDEIRPLDPPLSLRPHLNPTPQVWHLIDAGERYQIEQAAGDPLEIPDPQFS